ncbi:MAG: glycosyltransferase [Candidatus Acidiferrum sp.]
MSSAPLVTFVVPCYKYAHLLGTCVSSILVQDYSNFEVLIMDNCSPDNTPEVAQSFQDARVKHIRNDSNLGAEQNFNKGLTLARGKYVWILSADDLLRGPSVLRRFVDVMEQNADLAFVFCRAMELDGEKERGFIWWADCGDQDCTWNNSTFVARLFDFNCIAFSCVLLRKECLNRVGMFPMDLPFAADWYLWIMLAMHYEVCYLAEPMVLSRVHKDSLTSQQSRDYARICIGDEIDVLWRVGRDAKLAQHPNLRDACRSALIHRAKRCLMAGVSETEFVEILQSRIPDRKTTKDLRAATYRDLAEQHYSKGEYVAATQTYRLALKARPFHPGTLAKYLFMRTGQMGIWIRKFAHQVRKLSAPR